MAGPSWLVDPNRIATKIRSASGSCNPEHVSWKSNPTKSCPNCNYMIDNSDVADEWPGLPRGVKFDPSDQEIIWHLLAKVGYGNLRPHPFIDEFIPTVDEDDGICYTHPQNLPGVKQDGNVSHFFHRAIKAYNTGTRKRRKIHGDELGDVRWHKTGRTKPVTLDGVQKGCKKIMVLYISPVRGGKAEKTNWVMHQYHLGTGEDEKEGEYVVSKVFYQQQQVKQPEKGDENIAEGVDAMTAKVDPVTPKLVTPKPLCSEEKEGVHVVSKVFYQQQQVKQSDKGDEDTPMGVDAMIAKVDPVTPKSATPEPPFSELRSKYESRQESPFSAVQHQNKSYMDDVVETSGPSNDRSDCNEENHSDLMDDQSNEESDDNRWWENESQFLLSSQQLVEGLSLCDEFLQSQSPNREEPVIGQKPSGKPRLSDYAHLGPEDLKRDLEECQHLVTDPANIELDTPPDFRLSQLEFESEDSYIPWGGSAKGGNGIDKLI